MILQQSLADLGRAYRNWFADLKRVKAARAKGENAKLKVRKPRYSCRQHQQAIRFTANARFRLLPKPGAQAEGVEEPGEGPSQGRPPAR